MTTIFFYVRREGDAARDALQLVHEIPEATHIPAEGDFVDIPINGISSVRKIQQRIWCWDPTPPTVELLLGDEPKPWPPWEN